MQQVVHCPFKQLCGLSVQHEWYDLKYVLNNLIFIPFFKSQEPAVKNTQGRMGAP